MRVQSSIIHSSVASLPDSFKMILLPPGCEGRNDVTYTVVSAEV